MRSSASSPRSAGSSSATTTSRRLRQALIAAEDAGFDTHFGVSIPRIIVDRRARHRHRPAAGASTLTQQLARNLFPETIGFQKTWERKVKEALVTIQIEKRYTKREILTLYCNHVFFGHGAYGVESASRVYFGKHAKDSRSRRPRSSRASCSSPSARARTST